MTRITCFAPGRALRFYHTMVSTTKLTTLLVKLLTRVVRHFAYFRLRFVHNNLFLLFIKLHGSTRVESGF